MNANIQADVPPKKSLDEVADGIPDEPTEKKKPKYAEVYIDVPEHLQVSLTEALQVRNFRTYNRYIHHLFRDETVGDITKANKIIKQFIPNLIVPFEYVDKIGMGLTYSRVIANTNVAQLFTLHGMTPDKSGKLEDYYTVNNEEKRKPIITHLLMKHALSGPVKSENKIIIYDKVFTDFSAFLNERRKHHPWDEKFYHERPADIASFSDSRLAFEVVASSLLSGNNLIDLLDQENHLVSWHQALTVKFSHNSRNRLYDLVESYDKFLTAVQSRVKDLNHIAREVLIAKQAKDSSAKVLGFLSENGALAEKFHNKALEPYLSHANQMIKFYREDIMEEQGLHFGKFLRYLK